MRTIFDQCVNPRFFYFLIMINLYKQDIDIAAQENKNKFENSIENEDLKDIKDHFVQYGGSQHMKSFFKKGRDLVLKQVQDKVKKIEQYFLEDNTNEALIYVRLLYEYLTVRSLIRSKFEETHFCFINQFIENQK